MSNATETTAREHFAVLLAPARTRPVMELDGRLETGTEVRYHGPREDFAGEWIVAGGCLCLTCFDRMGNGEPQPLVLVRPGTAPLKHVKQSNVTPKAV